MRGFNLLAVVLDPVSDAQRAEASGGKLSEQTHTGSALQWNEKAGQKTASWLHQPAHSCRFRGFGATTHKVGSHGHTRSNIHIVAILPGWRSFCTLLLLRAPQDQDETALGRRRRRRTPDKTRGWIMASVASYRRRVQSIIRRAGRGVHPVCVLHEFLPFAFGELFTSPN